MGEIRSGPRLALASPFAELRRETPLLSHRVQPYGSPSNIVQRWRTSQSPHSRSLGATTRIRTGSAQAFSGFSHLIRDLSVQHPWRRFWGLLKGLRFSHLIRDLSVQPIHGGGNRENSRKTFQSPHSRSLGATTRDAAILFITQYASFSHLIRDLSVQL